MTTIAVAVSVTRLNQLLACGPSCQPGGKKLRLMTALPNFRRMLFLDIRNDNAKWIITLTKICQFDEIIVSIFDRLQY